MALSQEELQRLVRRDVTVAAVGVGLALIALLALLASRFGWVSEVNSARVAVALTAVVCSICLYTWASGPRELLRDRVVVLTPMFLISGPGLLGVHRLGGGVVAIMLSSAVGITGAAALGMAWSVRRRGSRG